MNQRKYPLAGNVLSDTPRARGRVAVKRVTYSHDVTTDQALDFVPRSHHQPFLLHVHWTIPLANSEGARMTGDGMKVPDCGIYAERDWPKTAKGQAAMITRMDKNVGRLVALLLELKIEG